MSEWGGDTERMVRVICALCGHDTLGDFYVGIPGHPDAYMHSVSCGHPLHGFDVPTAAEPTHQRLPDGSYVRLDK